MHDWPLLGWCGIVMQHCSVTDLATMKYFRMGTKFLAVSRFPRRTYCLLANGKL